MFTNVAIVSQPGPELQVLRAHLRNPMRFTVREFLSLDDVNHGLKSYPFDVLLMRLAAFDTPHVSMVLKVRTRFPNAGLITVSPIIHPSARYQMRDFVRHKLLQEPTELDDLAGVVEKLAGGDLSTPRQHSRVKREGECELVDTTKGVRIKGKFLDFAQMGARLMVNPRAPLKRNSRFQLHYQSTSEPNRMHRIEVAVMWAEMASGMVGTIMNGPQQIVGLRFIAAL